jgi:hypothetical protein
VIDDENDALLLLWHIYRRCFGTAAAAVARLSHSLEHLKNNSSFFFSTLNVTNNSN